MPYVLQGFLVLAPDVLQRIVIHPSQELLDAFDFFRATVLQSGYYLGDLLYCVFPVQFGTPLCSFPNTRLVSYAILRTLGTTRANGIKRNSTLFTQNHRNNHASFL